MNINTNKTKVNQLEKLIKSIIDIRAREEGKQHSFSDVHDEDDTTKNNNFKQERDLNNMSSNTCVNISSSSNNAVDGSFLNSKLSDETDEEKSRRKRYELAKKVLKS